MKNLVTQETYSGVNAKKLHALNVDEVCTFKQGVMHFKISGKQTKGLKSIATLLRYVRINRKGVERTVPKRFAVFNADDWRQRCIEIGVDNVS
jgi:hypothetical protein